MYRPRVEVKRSGLRARFVQLGPLVGLGCICITFGAMLADLLMRGEMGAVILASSVLAGVAWVVRDAIARFWGG